MSARTHPRKNGNKLAWEAFQGICTLRNGIGAAGRLAIIGKLGPAHKRLEILRAKAVLEKRYGK